MSEQVPFPDVGQLRAQLDGAFAGFFDAMAAAGARFLREVTAGLGRLRRLFARAGEEVRRALPLPPRAALPLDAHLRRLHWAAIARQHAARPPTRGFSVRRTSGLACRERKGLA